MGDRASAVTGAALLVATAARLSGGRAEPLSRTAISMVVGIGPAIIIVAAVQNVAAIRMSSSVAGAALLGAWTLSSRTLGAAATGTIRGPGAFRDIWGRILAVTIVTAFVGGAMARLLFPSTSTVQRLAWILGEEDNAHVVGVARELLADGPRGAGLADQFGTAFMSLPLLLAEFVGGLPAAESDVRLQAISAFTVSTLVVILLAGLAMATLAALPHHVHRAGSGPVPGLGHTIVASIGTGAATAVGMSLLVVLPMRTGFLTFVWGITLVLIGASTAAAVPPNANTVTRIVLLGVLFSLAVLLLSSWPFILPALAGLFLIPLSWVRWSGVIASVRRHPGLSVIGALATLAASGVTIGLFSRWGPTAEVLSYGTNILLAQASGIAADDLMRHTAFASWVVAAVLLVAFRHSTSTWSLVLSVTGPVLGALALYGVLRLAAMILTGGELNYAGVKLLYGVVVLASILGLLAVLSQVSRFSLLPSVAATFLALSILSLSPTAALITDWWERTDLGAPPHAVAAISMIGQTSPNLPIRCLPAPGTRITDGSRWAAYWCARWMEDAFNEGRFQGFRDELLRAEGETFAPLVEDIVESSPTEYLFSARMTLGPGWFGWDGKS